MGMGHQPPSDEAIKRAIARDLDEGFTEMVRAHQPGIYAGSLRLLRDRDEAADVAQETFLRAYRALESYDDERIDALRLRPWLWTIAVNLCRSTATRRRPHTAFDARHEVATEDAHVDMDDWNRRLELLTAPQRTAVVLRHVADLPIAEISEVTGRPGGTVKADISRGLARLRRTLEAEALT